MKCFPESIINPSKECSEKGIHLARNSCRGSGDKRLPVRIIIARKFLSVGLLWVLIFATAVYSQPSKAAGPADWDMLVDAAKKEGKVSLSIPASAELRKQLEDQFKKRYGVEVEVFTGRGSAAVRRMADEFKAGVRHFDLHIGGSSSIVSGMLDE